MALDSKMFPFHSETPKYTKMDFKKMFSRAGSCILLAQKLRTSWWLVADGDESTSPRILRLRRVAEARGCQGPANDDAAVSTRDNQADTSG